MDLVVYDDQERRYVPWLVTLAAVVLVGVLAALVTFLLTRGTSAQTLGGVGDGQAAVAPLDSPSPSPLGTAFVLPDATPTEPLPTAEPSASSAAPTPAPVPATESTASEQSPASTSSASPSSDCAQALAQADALLERSVRVGQALSEHTRIMDELLAKRLTAEQALDQTLPVLTTGAKDRDLLEDVLQAYQSAREQCPA